MESADEIRFFFDAADKIYDPQQDKLLEIKLIF